MLKNKVRNNQSKIDLLQSDESAKILRISSLGSSQIPHNFHPLTSWNEHFIHKTAGSTAKK